MARAGELPAAALLLFVALVPWLLVQGQLQRLRSVVLSGWAFTVLFTAATLHWFGAAVGQYVEVGEGAGLLVLLLAAPLLQPQIMVAAVARHLAGKAHGPALQALAAACAWVATEAWWPKLLGDSLGHGLYPLAWLRQAANLGGVAGLTLLVLLANEGFALAWARWRSGLGGMAVLPPAAAALAVALMLAVYGLAAPAAPQPAAHAGSTLRMGLVQSNIVHYERLRRERGSGAVVREVLDTHYAMSYDAVERQGAQAVLWSETVYPTTFMQPKSEAGAELDAEILGIVKAAGVPFVFGTYTADAQGEYNAAAFVMPGAGHIGSYRKSRPFPFTESVPAWLDGPWLRRLLPWAGQWRAGDGARVFPLQLKDGRSVPVLPLICLDDVDTSLAISGARLGAQAIVGMSNDSWFTEHPLGARLHLAVAAFRSIETGLPQFRVTSNGYSAVIDAAGTVQAGSRMGERTLVVGDVVVGEPRRTLVVLWGDWVGPMATLVIVAMLAAAQARRWRAAPADPRTAAVHWPVELAVLSPGWRAGITALRLVSRGSLLWAALAVAMGLEWLPSQTMAQMRAFVLLVLAPEAVAWLLLQACKTQVSVVNGSLQLQRGQRRMAMPLASITVVRPWRWPLPLPGADVHGDGKPVGLAGMEPAALMDALALAGTAARPQTPSPQPRWNLWLHARAAVPHWRLAHPALRLWLYPLLLAVPAYSLHQHIAFGSSFGELQAHGWAAYAKGQALWWASWAMGVAVWAAVLRALAELLSLAGLAFKPAQVLAWRRALERLALAAFYLSPPAWLLWRTL